MKRELRKIYCPELQKVFYGVEEVCEWFGCTKSNVSNIIKHRGHIDGKYSLCWYDDWKNEFEDYFLSNEYRLNFKYPENWVSKDMAINEYIQYVKERKMKNE